MKRIGYIFVLVGIALLIYLITSFLWPKNDFIAPIPDDEGVKVIFITPAN